MQDFTENYVKASIAAQIEMGFVSKQKSWFCLMQTPAFQAFFLGLDINQVIFTF